MRMTLFFVPISWLCARLAMSACGGKVTSTPNASGSSTPISCEAMSGSVQFSVENQLKDWWGGPGVAPMLMSLCWIGTQILMVAGVGLGKNGLKMAKVAIPVPA